MASAWIFQGNPKEWDMAKYVRDVRDGRADGSVSWLVDGYADEIAAGDRAYFWCLGDDRVAGVLATGQVLQAPAVLPEDHVQYRRLNSAEKHSGERMRAVISIERILPKTLFRVKLQWDAELKEQPFLTAGEQIVVAVSETVADALDARCDALKPPRGRMRSAA